MCTELEKVLENIKETAEVIHSHGWGEAAAGNLSIRLKDSLPFDRSNYYELSDRYENLIGRTIVITSSGSRMRQIASKNTEEYCCIITLNETGTGYYKVNNNDKDPSSELIAHLMLHNEFIKRRKPVTAIMHCHPDEIITLLHLADFKNREAINKMLFSIHTEAELIIPDGAGLVGLKKPGSYEFASTIFTELKKRNIALIEKHGCISVGQDLNDALDKIEFVNKAIKIYLDIKKLR